MIEVAVFVLGLALGAVVSAIVTYQTVKHWAAEWILDNLEVLPLRRLSPRAMELMRKHGRNTFTARADWDGLRLAAWDVVLQRAAGEREGLNLTSAVALDRLYAILQRLDA